MRLALVAVEPSGDLIGAELIKAIKKLDPELEAFGIGGPEMQAQGFRSLYPMERLSVMGLFEVLPRLPELLRIRRSLIKKIIASMPDAFIGIDAPDFNLGIAKKLKPVGIKTIQYVAPTVWAWKEHRVKILRQHLDLLLSIYPFEKDFLEQHRIRVSYVGHHLADQIPLDNDTKAARERLGIHLNSPVLALLPGSRLNEVNRVAKVFIEAGRLLKRKHQKLQIISPMATPQIKERFRMVLARIPNAPEIQLIDNNADTLLEAADVVLLFSGTASLQALLYKKPMVVAAIFNPLSYFILKYFYRVSKEKAVLANLLSGEQLAPFFVQNEANPNVLAEALEDFLVNQEKREKIYNKYKEVQILLKSNTQSGDQAAAEIRRLIFEKDKSTKT